MLMEIWNKNLMNKWGYTRAHKKCVYIYILLNLVVTPLSYPFLKKYMLTHGRQLEGNKNINFLRPTQFYSINFHRILSHATRNGNLFVFILITTDKPTLYYLTQIIHIYVQCTYHQHRAAHLYSKQLFERTRPLVGVKAGVKKLTYV